MSDNWKMQDDEAAMPIGTGAENTNAEIAFPSDKKPKVQAMTLLLIMIFAGGLGLIYAVGVLHKPGAASAAPSDADTKITTALNDFASKTTKGGLKGIFADTDRLVRMFYDYPGKASLPVDQLPANPFEYVGTSKGPDPFKPPVSVVPEDKTAAERERLRKLAESFGTLKLQTVMVSANDSMAQINGKLVRVGNRVGEFTVDAIESKRVVLRNGESTFALQLDQQKME